MKRSIFLTLGLCAVAFAATAETGAAEVEAPAANKSIVPNKYGNKYKNGGSDPVANFINDQCTATDKDGKNPEFVYSTFFALCRANGLAEDYVAKYEAQVAEGARGTQGRARMTLGNSLRALARKNGKLLKVDGETEVEITGLEKPALSGSAKAAAEKSAANEATESDDATDSGDAPAEAEVSEVDDEVTE